MATESGRVGSAETGSKATPEARSGLRPKGYDPARKPLRCRLGWHDWKLSDGRGYTMGTSRMAIFYTRDCRRCGKHEDKLMAV
jgi:hypothetical protein